MHHPPVDPGAPPTSLGPKPWWKVSYLWILILVNVGSIAAAATDLFPPKWVPFITAISTGCYAVARGLVGMGKAMANVNMSAMVQTAETVAAQTAEVVVAETVRPEAKK